MDRKIEGFTDAEMQWLMSVLMKEREENRATLTELAMMHEGKAVRLTPQFQSRSQADLFATAVIDTITKAFAK